MITLSFLQLLEDEGYGTIDGDLFWQKLGLDKVGVYIADLGEPVSKGARDSQAFELLARDVNDVEGYMRLNDIRRFIIRNYSTICVLPAYPPFFEDPYTNVEISKPSTITNVGPDAKGRIVYSMACKIIYKENL